MSGFVFSILIALEMAATFGRVSAGPRLRFSETAIFVELNDTDGDLGIHASIDGEAWTELEIEGPAENMLLHLVSRGRLRAQGLTQLSFESAEPPFDELAPAEFFLRFPEGRYTIEGRTAGGEEVAGTAMLSHVLAAPPANILISGVPAAANCDAEPLPTVFTPVVVSWEPVTQSHPSIGKSGAIKTSRYQVIVEGEGVSLSVNLPPTVTSFEIPDSVINLTNSFKLEIIVRTTAGNNTAVETCFKVA